MKTACSKQGRDPDNAERLPEHDVDLIGHRRAVLASFDSFLNVELLDGFRSEGVFAPPFGGRCRTVVGRASHE